MEDNVEVFPESSIDEVLNKIKSGAHAFRSLQDYVIELMKVLDTNGDGYISFDEFNGGLKKMNIFLTDQ